MTSKTGEHQATRGSDREFPSEWDYSSHEQFYRYYANASQTQVSLQRFASVREVVLRIAKQRFPQQRILEVADIGCGAGTQCMLWAELGHHAHGLDVNEPLLKLGRERADKLGYAIDFRVGSATQLPWPDESIDVCTMLEFLEHVEEWKACVLECIRILKPGGILFLTTSNKLCPVQSEFNLPLYSWYPAGLKRHFERLAKTSKPELANFAKYPAVNWFTFYNLRRFLADQRMQSLDRFDLVDSQKKNRVERFLLKCVRSSPPFRFFAHVAMEGTIVLAVKEDEFK